MSERRYKGKGFKFKDRGKYFAERARSDSDATPEQRAYARGYLQAQKNQNITYNYHNKKNK